MSARKAESHGMNLHIVTGGSRGLGRSLVNFLAESGDDVADISRSGTFCDAKLRSFNCDLSSAESKEPVFQDIFRTFPVKRYDRITLINNAGIVDPIKHVVDLDAASVARNIAINLVAPIALTSAFLKRSSDFDGLRIVANISSGAASRPKGSWATYSAAKAGLECFSTALARDFANDDRVKSVIFEPGIVDTDMQARIRDTDPANFDEVAQFLTFKKSGQLLSAETVAAALGAFVLRDDLASLTKVSIRDLIKSQ
ncbi:SDR family NAD(P)-dependent oxidoreductase [Bradyrhizobium sp. BR 10289]|nr:SDR family NAD(P)-dependent oxidoreductase [Bradyrhizobium sp. BR 10289]